MENPRLLHTPLRQHAAARPDHPAVDDGQHVITYAELHARVEGLAGALAARGAGPEERVGVLLDNGVEGTVALLAALRTGAAYVPLQPTFPDARLAAIVQEADVCALVADGGSAARARALADEPPVVVDVEETGPSIEVPAIDSSANAYVMFTSGTTGRPKGVQITHANVLAFLRWVLPTFAITPDDRMSGHSRLSFDLSVLDVFGALFAGATACPLVGAAEVAFPGPVIRDRRLTLWFSVPSVLSVLDRTGQLRDGAFNGLRHALFCGEAMNAAYARRWLDTHPDVPLWNLYGPTEATVACTALRVTEANLTDTTSVVPIGRPLTEVDVAILSEDGDDEVPHGEAGRLCVIGPQVSRGYWRRPDLDAAVFDESPTGQRRYDTGDIAAHDGDALRWIGRRDSQVKLAGYRVELSEIEAVIGHVGSVHEVAAFVVGQDVPELLAAIALDDGVDAANGEEAIYQACERALPAYMTPRQLVRYAQLPKNANGKIDRRQLVRDAEERAS